MRLAVPAIRRRARQSQKTDSELRSAAVGFRRGGADPKATAERLHPGPHLETSLTASLHIVDFHLGKNQRRRRHRASLFLRPPSSLQSTSHNTASADPRYNQCPPAGRAAPGPNPRPCRRHNNYKLSKAGAHALGLADAFVEGAVVLLPRADKLAKNLGAAHDRLARAPNEPYHARKLRSGDRRRRPFLTGLAEAYPLYRLRSAAPHRFALESAAAFGASSTPE